MKKFKTPSLQTIQSSVVWKEAGRIDRAGGQTKDNERETKMVAGGECQSTDTEMDAELRINSDYKIQSH